MDPLEESPWGDSAAAPQQSEQAPLTTEADATKSPSQAALAPRPSRTAPRRMVAQTTRLEAVDDPLGPLGPLGAPTPEAGGPETSQDAPPVPPQKEDMVIRTTMPSQPARRMAPSDPNRIDDDEDGFNRSTGPRAPPPVQAAQPSPVRSSTNPSVSIEQASKPAFQITVGDPHKVGDFTSSHVQYAVRTRVSYSPPAS